MQTLTYTIHKGEKIITQENYEEQIISQDNYKEQMTWNYLFEATT